MQTETRPCCDKPGTEVFIVDGSPAAALALGAHRPSLESTYVLSRAAHERGVEFKQRVLKRAERIRARQRIGSLWYVIGSPSIDSAGSVQLLQELLPLLGSGSSVTLASPRRHGRVVFGWIDELLGKGSPDVSMGVHFYSDAGAPQLLSRPSLPLVPQLSSSGSSPFLPAPAAPQLRRGLVLQPESSLQCA